MRIRSNHVLVHSRKVGGLPFCYFFFNEFKLSYKYYITIEKALTAGALMHRTKTTSFLSFFNFLSSSLSSLATPKIPTPLHKTQKTKNGKPKQQTRQNLLSSQPHFTTMHPHTPDWRSPLNRHHFLPHSPL